MVRIGPAWADEFCLSLEWADSERIDGYLAAIACEYGLPGTLLTDLLIALGGSVAWTARQPHRPGLPSLAAFCADQTRRVFSAVERITATRAGSSG